MRRGCRVAFLAACLLGLCSSSAWAIIYLPYTPPAVTAEGMACWPRSYTAGPVYVGVGPLPWVCFHGNGEDLDQRCDTLQIVNDGLIYKWNFGDGSAEEWAEYPTHPYSQTGEYTATCTAYDTSDPPKYADEGASPPDTIVVRVFQVDLNMAGVADNEEEDPGGFVAVNDDDDDQDHLLDFEDPSVPGGDNDLVAITLAVHGPAPAGGVVRISWKEDPPHEEWGEIDVFENPDKSNQVTRNTPYALASLPKTLYVEGDSVSAALGDVELKLEFLFDGNLCLPWDTVKVTVTDVDLKEVCFSGANYYDVRLDDDTDDYCGPHWQDNSSPLDGDADDQGDRKYPACFTRNTKMKTCVKVIVAPAAAFGGTVQIRGDGPGNLDIPATTATVVGGEATTSEVECSNAFPNQVQRYASLDIAWEISPNGGGSWLGAGTSKNEMFITLGTPGCAKRFRTVLYLATKNGGTDEDTCLSNTWASFSGPANVCAWDESGKDYTRALHYWDDPEVPYMTAAELVEHADGQCHAWADLLKECLLANNVSNLKRSCVTAATGYNQFAVKNTDLDGDPQYPEDPPWIYGPDDVDTSPVGIPGQNEPTPQCKLFFWHWLVHRTGDLTWYDPSYGRTATGENQDAAEADFTTDTVDAWADQMDSELHWRKVSSEPAVHVTFGDEDWP